MADTLEGASATFTCPKCGFAFEVSVGELCKNRKYKCSSCNAIIDTESLQLVIERNKSRVNNLHKAFIRINDMYK